jgi:hypothetical protein
MSLQISSKLKALLLISLTLGVLGGCQKTDSNLYGYNFQTARISYKISGSSEGTSEVLIKGEKKVIKTHIVQTAPTPSEVDSYTIQNGDKQYTLDVKTKKGNLITNPFYAELSALPADQRQERLIKEAIRSTDDAAPKAEKQEEVAGQKCDVYAGALTKTCLWQAIPLKTVASLPEYGIQTDTTATKIELNTSIADSEFDVPSDYQITELK